MISICPAELLPWVSFAYICHVVYLFSQQKTGKVYPFYEIEQTWHICKKNMHASEGKNVYLFTTLLVVFLIILP